MDPIKPLDECGVLRVDVPHSGVLWGIEENNAQIS